MKVRENLKIYKDIGKKLRIKEKNFIKLRKFENRQKKSKPRKYKSQRTSENIEKTEKKKGKEDLKI